MANTDPKRTFFKKVNRNHLAPEFAGDIRQIRMEHGSFRVSLALKDLSDIQFFPPGEELTIIHMYINKKWRGKVRTPGRCFWERTCHGEKNQMNIDMGNSKGEEGARYRSDISLFPDIEAQAANFLAANEERLPGESRPEITVPSTLDDSLAPLGHHEGPYNFLNHSKTASRSIISPGSVATSRFPFSAWIDGMLSVPFSPRTRTVTTLCMGSMIQLRSIEVCPCPLPSFA